MSIVDIVSGEVTKARTLRPLMLTAGIAIAGMLGYCLLDTGGTVKMTLADPAGIFAESVGQHVFVNLSFLPILVAVPIVASEYAGGQLTSSVLAAPRRGRLLVAKFIVTTVYTAILGLLLAVMVLVFYQGRFGEHSVFATGTSGEYVASLVLAVCYWIVLGLLSACGVILFRSQAVVLAITILLTFMSFVLLLISPHFQYLPTIAGQTLFVPADQLAELPRPPDLSLPVAAGITLAWTVAAMIAASVVFIRRDIGARQLNPV